MIAKVIRARGYKGVCEYIFNHGDPELLGGNIAAHDADTAIKDLMLSEAFGERSSDPVCMSLCPYLSETL